MKADKWIGGLAEWDEGDNTYLSIAFTWKLDEAYSRAMFAKALGKKVYYGGPAVFLVKMRHELTEVAQFLDHYPEAVTKHNPMATFASRGCPVGCGFCIVPAMEGKEFTFIPDFTPRPILCDNNLSALPADYQQHIIDRYTAAGVPLYDANSGFEPITFTPDVYARWAPLVNAGRGPWRFAYDETKERTEVLRVMKMLDAEPAGRKQVYTLIGNEPFDDCIKRIDEVIKFGCEPYAQPMMKLTSLDRKPVVRFDWTEQKLKDVARWTNRRLWRNIPFSEYAITNRHSKEFTERQSLFNFSEIESKP